MKLVITQAGTIEGYTAAWVAKRILKGDCEIVFMGPGDRLPDVVKRDVLVLGLSFSRNLVSRIVKEAAAFKLFDNDFRAKQELSGIKEVKINMKQTPARMAWEYLRGDIQVKIGAEKKIDFKFSSAPWIVDYSENTKLWRWPNLNPFFIKTAIENCYKQELEDWDELASRDLECVIAQGKEFSQKQKPEEKGAENDTRTQAETGESGEQEGPTGEDAGSGSSSRRARRKLSKQ